MRIGGRAATSRVICTFPALSLVILVLLCPGCTEELSDQCDPPGLISWYCGEEPKMSACNCNKGPIDICGYVDLARLPGVCVVASQDEFASDYPVSVYAADSGPGPVEIGYDPDYADGVMPEVIVRLADAYLLTVWQPGNGIQIATWRLEVESEEQLSYWIVEDGEERPLSW